MMLSDLGMVNILLEPRQSLWQKYAICAQIRVGGYPVKHLNVLEGYQGLAQCQREAQTHFKSQSLEIRNAEICFFVGCSTATVWAQESIQKQFTVSLQIMISYSICTPPKQFWECYLSYKGCCGSLALFHFNPSTLNQQPSGF
jgi:hypothetical protein